MATSEIAWGDGTGDKIYLTYTASAGDQTVSVSSDANTGAARSKTVTFSATGVSPVTLSVSQEAGEPSPDRACLTFRSTSSNTLSMTCNGTAAPVLYYSTNGTTWTLWDYSSLSITEGHPVFIYGNNPSAFSSSTDNYACFVMGGDGRVNISGNIMTLADNGLGTMTTIPRTYYFYRIFRNCAVLRTAPAFPATTLKNYCYMQAFANCTYLLTPPELPATTLTSNCYNQMFRECRALTSAPVLPALTLTTRCYYYMFYNCRALSWVKALFTTTPGSYTTSWLEQVNSTGTFVKNSAATWTTTGVSGVPTNWTIEYASA